MRISIFLSLLLLISDTLFSQDVIISGVHKNRPLTWDDFTGDPDKSSSYAAHTYWNVNYRFKGVTYKADTAVITEPEVVLELNKQLSWVKKGKESTSLLKHEQGHFDIGLLCQKELIALFSKTVFFRSDAREKMQSLFKATLDRYTQMGIKYDDETNHGKNLEKQEKWNEFFAKELNAGNP